MAGAGSLDRRLSIQRLSDGTVDAYNAPTITWETVTTVWAARSDISDAEKLASSQIGSALISRFVIRSSTISRLITSKDRLLYDGAYWNILGIKETKDGRSRFLELTAVMDSDA